MSETNNNRIKNGKPLHSHPGFESNLELDGIGLQHYPIFGTEVFQDPTALLSTFNPNALSGTRINCRDGESFVSVSKERLSWSLVQGLGFCGATHPGARKVLDAITTRARVISNSDCLYVNMSDRVFAVSDAPDLSVYSRKLLTDIDENLGNGQELEEIVNSASQRIGTDDHATLSLICFPPKEAGTLARASVFVAGDSYVLYGNRFDGKLARIEGNPLFIGRSCGQCEPHHLDLMGGDFFVIASDGILEARTAGYANIEDALKDSLDLDDLPGSTLRIVQRCNAVTKDEFQGKEKSRPNGWDNVSVLIVYPERLTSCTHSKARLLGGWISYSPHSFQ
ncbi:MAG: SpoIIE family protein phosphatase [Chloroflexi bacterium]|nr:SpoIIE family protein phosphatase [Chloroflexota bacterium]